jgi:hypothetical protein
MSDDLLDLGLWQLQRRSLDGDLGAAAVLDYISALRSRVTDEHLAHHLDTDVPLYDATHFIDAAQMVTPYSQSDSFEVLK